MFPKTIVAQQTVCKCCGNMASLYDVCDFSKNCEEQNGLMLPLSGIAVFYYKCPRCDFIFTTQFDDTSHDEFTKYIYNDEYLTVDPDYAAARPDATANLINITFSASKEKLRILDYGGGNGRVEKNLKEMGFKTVDTYDPFSEQYRQRPGTRYDLVLAFEVVEHVPDVIATFKDMQSFLDSDGILMFSTLVQPDNMDTIKVKWLYISPRNGHISIYSAKSLQVVLNGLGLRHGMASQSLHFAYNQIPSFAKHIFKPG
jgi:hypothetical protein